ncbi:hypothetical protein LguiA_035671 [Lonicera macranthoides]
MVIRELIMSIGSTTGPAKTPGMPAHPVQLVTTRPSLNDIASTICCMHNFKILD